MDLILWRHAEGETGYTDDERPPDRKRPSAITAKRDLVKTHCPRIVKYW